MEDLTQEILHKVFQAYKACSLQTVKAFNKFQFEKMLDEIYDQYENTGIEREQFNKLVEDGLVLIGAFYRVG